MTFVNGDVTAGHPWDLGDVLVVTDGSKGNEVPRPRRGHVEVVDDSSVPDAMEHGLKRLTWKDRKHGGPSWAYSMTVADARRLAAADLLFFPEGGPTPGAVYARHPLRRRDYLPFASYHRLILTEKAIEFARHLLAHGASDIAISWSEKPPAHTVKGRINSVLPTPSAADVQGAIGFTMSQDGAFVIRIGGGGRGTTVPEGLVWPYKDKLFQLAAESAFAGARDLHFSVSSGTQRGVNAEAAVKLKGVGLDLGGEYKRWEDVHFTLDAKFPETVPTA